ncbi:mitochondrial genome maintenance exonuclease 1 [Hippoglossus hippoglossus]|uniref:mitochondrial genome maintenance exonuclease 1 n=1 Tax=Hippoglossus hippoglossus TaxID=8267 RepID=UPI00148B4CE8|nr:mitochondrial genome maintenance exonuclease 1 [Hippoglossus hippoglossus]XP_034463977.1 mitochondrial genome maintenance exonuclease 1 [Hippoglossus hippoglossus]
MFIVKRVVCVGGIMLIQCTSRPVRNFSACSCLNSPKRRSSYSLAVSERYSSLVKSVMSSRVSSQTPDTLQAEDEHIYGPVVKAQTPSSKPERREPKTLHPFLLSEKTLETEETESGLPVRILLKRGQGGSSAPSVTRILQQTLSPDQRFYLERWKRRMIEELGEDGFKEYSQNLFRQGKLFHSTLDDIMASGATQENKPPAETPEYPAEVQGYMESVSHILEDVSAVRAIESTVHHDTLDYLGIVDCVARYRGVLCLIDWKTSEKPKPFLSNTYDNPIQVAAYAGALNNDGNYKYQVDHGLIVVAYKDGSPAHAHQLSSELMLQYWRTWLLRLEKFTEQRSGHTSTAFSEKK